MEGCVPTNPLTVFSAHLLEGGVGVVVGGLVAGLLRVLLPRPLHHARPVLLAVHPWTV